MTLIFLYEPVSFFEKFCGPGWHTGARAWTVRRRAGLLCSRLDYLHISIGPCHVSMRMIQRKQQNVEKIRRSVRLSQEDEDREKAEGVQIFTALKESVERGLIELINKIEEKQETAEKQAEESIKQLEEEIYELKRRSTEVKQLSRSEDHLHLLQSVQSLNIQPPPSKDWTEVSVRPPSHVETVVRAVVQLEEKLNQQMKKLHEAELKRVQQFAVDVTIDPETANPWLLLSEDRKQVNDCDEHQNLPRKPKEIL